MDSLADRLRQYQGDEPSLKKLRDECAAELERLTILVGKLQQPRQLVIGHKTR